MNKPNAFANPVSRRKLLKASAGAGAALVSTLAAPPILAQANAPIRIGNLNSYTGGLSSGYALAWQQQILRPWLPTPVGPHQRAS